MELVTGPIWETTQTVRNLLRLSAQERSTILIPDRKRCRISGVYLKQYIPTYAGRR